MHVITRKEAKALGLIRYFTGQSCRFGHVCERYTNNSHCLECEPAEAARYRERHRQVIREKNARYRRLNKDALNEKHREYRAQNLAKIAKKDQEYRIANREKLRAKSKEYRDANKDIVHIKAQEYRKRKKRENEIANKLVSQPSLQRAQAKPIAAPDWDSIKHDMNTTLLRAEKYRDIYRTKKNSFGY